MPAKIALFSDFCKFLYRNVTKVTVTVFWVSNMGFSKKNLQNIITIYIFIYIVKFSIQLFSANYRNCNCHYCNKLNLLAQGDKIASHVWKIFFSRVRVKMCYHFNNSLTFDIWLSHGIVVSLQCIWGNALRVRAAAQHSSSELGSAFTLHLTCTVKIKQITTVFLAEPSGKAERTTQKLN